MGLEFWIALVGLAALIAYALLGGADFGGGIWDLLAVGPRAAESRAAISRAMGPVWEANHVWLIFLIVLLFSCFPPAFSALSIGFFVPFHLVLVGIMLRGAAFVFRGSGSAPHPRWSRVFGIASSVTPFLLGLCLGALSDGSLRVTEGRAVLNAAMWTSPFCWSLGLLSLAICAYLAAVYLTLETEGELREEYRRKALAAGVAMFLCAAAVLVAARWNAPRFLEALIHARSLPVLAGGLLMALASAWAVQARRYVWARVLGAAQVTLLVLGWALAQQPYLIYPDLTLAGSAAPEPTLRFVLVAVAGGMVLLIPSLALLFRVFKGGPPAQPIG